MKQDKGLAISPTNKVNRVKNMVENELKECLINKDNAFQWTKITLIVFYILEIASVITLTLIKVYWLNKQIEKQYYYEYDGSLSKLLALNWLGLLYHMIYSVIGIIGVIKESKAMMFAWTCLGVVAVVSHGLLYLWMSSVLVSFTTVLTAVYAVLIYFREKSQITNKVVTDPEQNGSENVQSQVINNKF